MFQISDKVVCVDDSNPCPEHSYPNGYVKKGQIYVISGFYNNAYDKNGPQIVGFPAISFYGNNVGWKSKRFRKLSDIKAENARVWNTANVKSLLHKENFSTPQMNNSNKIDYLKSLLQDMINKNRI